MRPCLFPLVALLSLVAMFTVAPVAGQPTPKLRANYLGEVVVRRDADLESLVRRHRTYPSRLYENQGAVRLIGRGSDHPSSSSGGKGKGKGKVPALDPYAVSHIVDAAHRMDTHVDAADYHLSTARTLLFKPNRTPEEEAQLKFHSNQAHKLLKTDEQASAEEKVHLASSRRPFDGKVTKTSKYAPPYRNGRPSEHNDGEATYSGREDEKKKTKKNKKKP